LPDRAHDALAPRLVEINDRNLGALGGEQLGDLLADIASGTSHDRNLVFELHLSAHHPRPAVITFTKGTRQQGRPRGIAANMLGNAQNMDFAMAAPLKTVEGSNIAALMHEIGQRAKSAARVLALAPTAQKDSALAAMAAAIRARQADILAANAKDVAEAKAAGATAAFVDRLALDERRIAAMADGLDVVRALPDPAGAPSPSGGAGDRSAGGGRAASPSTGRACRAASPPSSTSPARTPPPMPPRCASRPATPPSCAAARRVTARTKPFTPRCSRGCARRRCPRLRSPWCRPASGPRSG